MVDIPIWGISETPGRYRIFEGPFGEIHSARRPTAAPRSTLVPKHQVGVCGHGAHYFQTSLRGIGGEYRLFEVTLCEYVM